MRFYTRKRNLWLLAALFAGSLILAYGVALSFWQNTQYDSYNRGTALFTQALEARDEATAMAALTEAIQSFDQSIAAYKAESQGDWYHRFTYPKPDRELAALAYFHKAKALLFMQKGPQAVEAFKESLKLNPGNGYEGMSLEQAQRMFEQAMVVKYDLELLFKNNPSLAQQQGKGKPGQGQGEGNQQVPGTQPGTQPGKGNKDDI